MSYYNLIRPVYPLIDVHAPDYHVDEWILSLCISLILKNKKREMYGRASFALLRKKCVCCILGSCTKSDEEPEPV